ncbi:MAG: helix-turn-helix domain-containing protein [Streptococcaceae bacterium]|jgi:DNA-binding transcriptional MerR regulator|nr:helix-turn-helix domain-containing protein [Streptococcaceae bacterium]
MERIKIGEFAELNRVSVQALRYYEKMGLLKPDKVDKKTGYRYYLIEQSSIVDMIQTFQRLNFSIKEIKEIFHKEDKQVLLQLLEEREKELKFLQSDIPYRLSMIGNLRDTLELIEHYQPSDPVTFQYFDERFYFEHFTDENIYGMTMPRLESELRIYKKIVLENGIPISYHGVGSVMLKELFDASVFDTKSLVVFLTTEKQKKFQNGRLEKGEYAVLYADSFAREKRLLQKFHDEIERKGYETIGPYISEVLYEVAKHDEKKHNMFIRMQIQVVKREEAL